MSMLLYSIICQASIPLNSEVLKLVGIIIAFLVLVYNIHSGRKKDRKEQKTATIELITKKLDVKGFEEYKEIHSEFHAELRKDIELKASNEKMDMVLKLVENQQNQLIRIEDKQDKILEKI